MNIEALSGWQDSNLRPPGPKPGAIPGYATSRTIKLCRSKSYETGIRNQQQLNIFKRTYCGESGIRTHGTVLPVRRFSKPFLSATQASLLPALNFIKGWQKYGSTT